MSGGWDYKRFAIVNARDADAGIEVCGGDADPRGRGRQFAFGGPHVRPTPQVKTAIAELGYPIQTNRDFLEVSLDLIDALIDDRDEVIIHQTAAGLTVATEIDSN